MRQAFAFCSVLALAACGGVASEPAAEQPDVSGGEDTEAPPAPAATTPIPMPMGTSEEDAVALCASRELVGPCQFREGLELPNGTRVDVMVIEVGLLGRWDATNVVDATVAVITNIGLDHTEFAGPTLADIASEKAGIITENGAVVVGETDPNLIKVFSQEPHASMLVRDEDFAVVDNTLAVGGRLLDLRTPTTVYSDVYLPVHGAHQADNASAALCAVETFFAAPLADEVVREGFGAVELPGRFEVVGVQPLVIVDGAHNPPGADSSVGVYFDDFRPEDRRILVVGTLRDADEMISALRADDFDVVIACTAPTPRGVEAAVIGAAARRAGCVEVLVIDDPIAACEEALRQAGADDAILVAGSIYVVGSVRRTLLRHSGR